MLRITVELLPHGDEKRARVLALGAIINDGSGTTKLGNYTYDFVILDGEETKEHNSGRINGFRRTEDNVLYLVYRALMQIFTWTPQKSA